MNHKITFRAPSLDLDWLLATKVKLRQEGVLDAVLEATLRHATRVVEQLPPAKRRDVSLTLEGATELVCFEAGAPSYLHYTIHLGEDGPEFRQKVYASGSGLTLSDVLERHFCGHRCRDELDSCLARARRILSDGDGVGGVGDEDSCNVELRIVCDELHLTYSPSEARRSVLIQPPRRVNLGHDLTLERLVEVKTHLEQSGAVGKGLLACLHHLVVNYRGYQGSQAHITLQAEGEMMELVCSPVDARSTQYYIFTDADDWHKVL